MGLAVLLQLIYIYDPINFLYMCPVSSRRLIILSFSTNIITEIFGITHGRRWVAEIGGYMVSGKKNRRFGSGCS